MPISRHQKVSHHRKPPYPARLSFVERVKKGAFSLIRVAVLCFILRLGIEYCEYKGWLSKLGHAQEFILAAVTNHVLFEVGNE